MTRAQPYNALHDRYASAEMAALFSQEHRYRQWRALWLHLAKAQQELGLPISDEQITALEAVADSIDFDRVAQIENETRHDVVAHLRHFAELAGAAGSILHLGATSAFITDNTDALLLKQGFELLERRLGSVLDALATFAHRYRALPALAYTHFQPAQLTTVGKRACLWAQDFLEDLSILRHRLRNLRCRGAKGTTGTQASYLTLFEGEHGKVRALDRDIAARLGFAGCYPITGQTYPRKQDSQVLAVLAGIAESCHKFGTDLRLLQGVGELAEPFGNSQVGSSAMAYKRNPIRAERMCALSRRLITDSLSGPLTAAVQWLERSLDDSANRRLVLTDTFLTADAVLGLAAGIAAGLTVREEAIAARVARELPFMATESLLMTGTVRGGDRQELHERIRQYSMDAYAAVARGEANPLIGSILADPSFSLDREEVDNLIDAKNFIGRSPEQVDEFIGEAIEPALAGLEIAPVEEPRV